MKLTQIISENKEAVTEIMNEFSKYPYEKLKEIDREFGKLAADYEDTAMHVIMLFLMGLSIEK